MDWISANWIWLLLVLGMIGMHMFGHRRGSRARHGAGRPHGGCCGGGAHNDDHGDGPRSNPR